MAHHPRYQLISQDRGVGMKTSELTGAALDWAVTKCEGYDSSVDGDLGNAWGMWGWATSWAQGGTIIEREGISVWARGNEWAAESFVHNHQGLEIVGSTPLIAAMRCYVASVMGDEVDVPEELNEVIYE